MEIMETWACASIPCVERLHKFHLITLHLLNWLHAEKQQNFGMDMQIAFKQTG